MMHLVFSPRLMNFNGPSTKLTCSAGSALADAIVPLTATKAVMLRSWANLINWVSQERRVRE